MCLAVGFVYYSWNFDGVCGSAACGGEPCVLGVWRGVCWQPVQSPDTEVETLVRVARCPKARGGGRGGEGGAWVPPKQVGTRLHFLSAVCLQLQTHGLCAAYPGHVHTVSVTGVPARDHTYIYTGYLAVPACYCCVCHCFLLVGHDMGVQTSTSAHLNVSGGIRNRSQYCLWLRMSS